MPVSIAVAPYTAQVMTARLPIFKWLPPFVFLADGGVNPTVRLLNVKWLLIFVILIDCYTASVQISMGTMKQILPEINFPRNSSIGLHNRRICKPPRKGGDHTSFPRTD